MKNTKVKGFTLIELIIVIAIFSIIMASATALMTPVSKIAVETDVMADGNKVVDNIAKKIESSLSTAEYMQAFTKSMSEADIKSGVEEFAQTYYGGVLRAGSKPESPKYAKGVFHVLQIDTANGLISEYVYETSDEGLQDIKDESGGVLNAKVSVSVTQTSFEQYAVNKAYYDKYSFQIKPGAYSTVEAFDAKTSISDTDRSGNIKGEGIVFTIKATTKRGTDKNEYSFVSTVATPLVNRHFDVEKQSVYYCLNKKVKDASSSTTEWVPYIENRSKDGFERLNPDDTSTDPVHTPILGRFKSKVDDPTYAGSDGLNDVYTFIYSYGSEIDTSEKS